MAAAEYVRRIAENAAILLRLGQAARSDPNREIALAAQQIVNRAVVVRLLAMRALIRLYLEAWMPGLTSAGADIFDRYNRLTESVVFFTRLQQPAYASRVSAML